MGDMASKLASNNSGGFNADSALMERAARELKSLREQNTIMGARLRMFDDMMSVFNLNNRRGEGGAMEVGMDNVRQLEHRSKVLSMVEKLHPEMQNQFTEEVMQEMNGVGTEKPDF